MQQQTIITTIEFVKNELKHADAGHTWWHIERVWNNARYIAKELPKANIFIVEMSALLHEVGDIKIIGGSEELGPKMVGDYLDTLDISKDDINHIIAIITDMSFRKTKEGGERYNSLEFQIVQDADRLESIGAIGIARTFSYGAVKQKEIYNPDILPNLDKTKEQYISREGTTINHFYEKLLLLKDMMHTIPAKKIAEKRHRFMEVFLKQFFDERNNTK